MGGVKTILINLADAVTEATVSGGLITAITKTAAFKKYAFAANSASATSTKTIDKANGVNFVTTDLVMKFSRMETTKRTEVEALSLNELVVVYEDANGKWWYLGKDEPVTASAVDGQTGAARSDSNAYNVTLEDISRETPYEVDADIIDGLLSA